MQGPCVIALRSNLGPQFFVCISPLLPNPKCCLVSIKPSGPPVLRRRLELNPSPVYYGVAPHAVVLLQTLPATRIIDFLQEDEGEVDL